MLLPEEFKDRMKKLLGSEYEEFMLSYNKDKYNTLSLHYFAFLYKYHTQDILL